MQAYLAVAGDSDGLCAFKCRVGLWAYPCPANAIFSKLPSPPSLERVWINSNAFSGSREFEIIQTLSTLTPCREIESIQTLSTLSRELELIRTLSREFLEREREFLSRERISLSRNLVSLEREIEFIQTL